MTKNRVYGKIWLSVCVAVLLLSISQVVTGQSENKTEKSNSSAVVYIYRYKQFISYMVEPSVYCNEVQLARMDNGRYFKVVLSPGKYTFRSNDKQSGKIAVRLINHSTHSPLNTKSARPKISISSSSRQAILVIPPSL